MQEGKHIRCSSDTKHILNPSFLPRIVKVGPESWLVEQIQSPGWGVGDLGHQGIGRYLL